MHDPLGKLPSSRLLLLLTLAAIAVMTACSDTPTVAPHQMLHPSATLLDMSSCGASFRMISTEQDDLMTPYGIPNTVDTVDVCEAWTGSDYAYQATAIGSSDNVPGFVDSVQTITYQSGNVTGYTQSANAAAPASPVGASSFDMLYADNSTRQASYDYPYYGISSPDPATCIQPPCPVQSLNTTARLTDGTTTPGDATTASNAPTPSASGNVVPQFAKHGLLRRGVRALVDDADEIARSKEGYRRFRVVHKGETIVRSIDPKTQLLMAEESDGPADTMFTTHVWTQVAGGYVRNHSDFETVEQVNGKRLRSRTRVAFQKVRISDPAFPALRSIDAIP